MSVEKMTRPEHLYGTSDRLFLNTELGCASACTYCYLPTEGFGIGLSQSERTNRITAQELLDALCGDPRVRKGPEGTLFSIGCFSEAWDTTNRPETIELIKTLLEFGNPIQLATKRQVKSDDLRKITSTPHWRGQLSIYISSATISHWKVHEPRTEAPARRFQSFDACREAGVSACLYIKPVIPGVTIIDCEMYADVLFNYGVPCIVGDRFAVETHGVTSPISEKLVVIHHNEAELIRRKLCAFGPVFSKSEAALAYLGRKKWMSDKK